MRQTEDEDVVAARMVLDRHRKISQANGEVTANNIMRRLRSVYNFTTANHGELPPNPVVILGQARAWNPERRRRSVIPQHGLPKWWRAVHLEDKYVRNFLLIALFTGMRRSDIARLRWEHIDLEGRTLTAPKTKNGDPLELPLSVFLHELLLTRREALPDADWVFPGPGETGHIVDTKKFYARVAKTVESVESQMLERIATEFRQAGVRLILFRFLGRPPGATAGLALRRVSEKARRLNRGMAGWGYGDLMGALVPSGRQAGAVRSVGWRRRLASWA